MNRVIVIIAAIGLALLSSPVSGAINTVSAGDTVFIGEQGLDISGAMGANTEIAFFPSTATSSSAVPEKVIDVSSTMTGFYVNPSDFSSRTGTWYSWSDGQTVGASAAAFRVNDPYLAIRVRDTSVDADATNKWIYRGDTGGFTIETNMYTMAERGIAGVPVTIKVQSPDGNIYSSLLDTTGLPQPLEVTIPSSPYTVPGVAWDTGNSRYPAGEYRVWAECNANSMKDNYPKTGRTVASTVIVKVQLSNPLIAAELTTTAPTATAATPAATASAPVVTTTQPATTTPAGAGTTAQATATGTPVSSGTGSVTVTPQPTAAPGFDAITSVLAGFAAIMFVIVRRH